MSAGGVRLIATDMDGTLLRADQTISSRTLTAIRDAHQAGIVVMAATGRGWRSAVPLLAGAPEVTTAVCSNGALVRDIVGEANTDVFAFPASAVQPLVDAVVSTVPDAGLAWELASGGFGFDAVYAELRPDVAAHYPDHQGARPPVVDDMLKLLVRHPQMDEVALLSVLEPVVPPDVLATYSGIDTVEITGAGVHKARALAVVCDRLGIDASEVVAVGDNRNDTEMLRWAGRGVAMGNALPAVVAVADEQTAHHMEDGVAIVIEDVLAGRR
jgi:hydroxymethylpyrimidine pyrophosphatase-like HAD family hydrolase